MPEPSPWDAIAVPNADFNVRQVPGDMVTPCCWGRDATGDCLFIIELPGDHTAQYRKASVTVNGIKVDLRTAGPAQQRLVLTLERQVDRDLFEGLCRTLALALPRSGDASGALAVALAHIGRWKAFMSGRGAQHLSPEAVRGLFAELSFLVELRVRVPAASAIAAWLGPERSQQDFMFGNVAVEIKSLSGAERSVVRVSSEDQLESLNDSLFLRTYRLSELPDADRAISLNELVGKIHMGLGEAEAVEAFDRKLAAHGYAPMPDYDEPRFVVTAVTSYQVREGFPRLIRSRLPTGVCRVSYDVQLEAILPYKCDNIAVFGAD